MSWVRPSDGRAQGTNSARFDGVRESRSGNAALHEPKQLLPVGYAHEGLAGPRAGSSKPTVTIDHGCMRRLLVRMKVAKLGDSRLEEKVELLQTAGVS